MNPFMPGQSADMLAPSPAPPSGGGVYGPPYLDPLKEQMMQAMAQDYGRQTNTNPNPDDPHQHYKYRDWYDAMLSDPTMAPQIDPIDGIWHLPSDYKTADSPERMVQTSMGGMDSMTENIITPGQTVPWAYR